MDSVIERVARGVDALINASQDWTAVHYPSHNYIITVTLTHVLVEGGQRHSRLVRTQRHLHTVDRHRDVNALLLDRLRLELELKNKTSKTIITPSYDVINTISAFTEMWDVHFTGKFHTTAAAIHKDALKKNYVNRSSCLWLRVLTKFIATTVNTIRTSTSDLPLT